MRTLVPLFFAAAVTLGTFALVAQAPPGGGKGGGKGGPRLNLKVLPDDANLVPAMRSFEVALGVMDCNFCHDANAGKDSDANPRKLKARMMISMVKDINKSFGDGKDHVTCYTCHRGSQTPLTAPAQ
jgi:hypothetical protein